MTKSNKEKYGEILRGKAELEKWVITTESDSDAKLYGMFFGDVPKQKVNKSSKTISITNLVFIVFGRRNLESLLENGLV